MYALTVENSIHDKKRIESADDAMYINHSFKLYCKL